MISGLTALPMISAALEHRKLCAPDEVNQHRHSPGSSDVYAHVQSLRAGMMFFNTESEYCFERACLTCAKTKD